MRILIYTFFLFPLFLNAQNEEFNKWRFNFSYQLETTGAFEASDTKNWNFFQMEREAGNGHSVQIGFERKFSKTTGLQSNLNYSNRNKVIRTGINFDEFNCLNPSCSFTIVHLENQIDFSNLELDAIFFSEQNFDKFGISAGIGLGIGYYLDSNIKTIDILQTSNSFLEVIDINGDLEADGFTGFGKMSVGFFYDYSELVRLFLRPTFKFDLTRTKSELLYNRFYAFGISVRM